MAVVEGTAVVKVDGVNAATQLENLEKKANDLKKQLVELRKQDVLDNKKLKDIQSQLNGVNKEIKTVKTQTTDYNAVLKNLSGASLKELQKAYKQLSIETSKAKRGTDEYKASAANMAKVKSEISKVKSEMNGAGTAAKGFGASMKNIASQMFAGGGIIAGVYAFVNVLKGAWNTIVEFGKASSNLQAIMGKTKAQMKELNDQAKQLGSTTAYTATQVTELQTELAKLGFSDKEILASSDAVLSLAAATGSELAPSAELAGATLRIFNLDASEMTRVADVLAISTTKSSLSMEKLATIMPTVGKTAQIAGVSLEKTVALAGTLTDRGLDASSAATSLRNIFLELSAKGLTWNEAMQKINSSTDKNKTALDLFGKRAAAAGVILAEQGDSVEKLNNDLVNLESTAKDMAKVMLDNVAGDVTIAQSAWEGFILSVEDGNGSISKSVRSLIQSFTDMLGNYTRLNDENLTLSERFKLASEEAGRFNLVGKQLKWIWDGIVNTFQKSKEAIYDLLNIEIEEDKAKKASNKTSKLRVTRLSEEKEKVKELTDEEKKAIEERLKANAQLIDQIKSLNVQLISDERTRAEEEVNLWREKELKKIEESKASANLKAQAVEAIEATHTQKLAAIDQKYNDELLKRYQGVEDFLKEQNARLEADRKDALQRDLDAISEKYDKELTLAEGNQDLINQLLQTKDAEIKAYMEEAEQAHAEKIRAIREEYGLVTDEEKVQGELDLLRYRYDQELLTREEYEKALANIISKYDEDELAKEKKLQEEKQKAVRESIQKQQAITSILGNFISAQKELELQDAGDNEEKKKEILKKYADKEFLVNASKIIANTAQAVMAAMTLGIPAGPIAAAVVGATGLAELTTANTERQRVKGLEEGGEFAVTREQDGKQFKARFGGRRRGYISKPTVLVGEHNKREFVVSNKSLQVPAIQRAVSAIDAYQSRTSPKYFNYKRVSGALAMQGFEAGGTIGTNTTTTGTNTQVAQQAQTQSAMDLVQLITAFYAFRDEITAWQSELKTYVLLDDINDAQDTLSTLQTEVKQ